MKAHTKLWNLTILAVVATLLLLVVFAQSPVEPSGVAATQSTSDNSITVTWTKTDNMTYDVFVQANSSAYTSAGAAGSNDFYTYVSGESGTTYTFVVQASNSSGSSVNSSPSNSVLVNDAPTIESFTVLPTDVTPFDLIYCGANVSDSYVPDSMSANFTLQFTGGSLESNNVACSFTPPYYLCGVYFNPQGNGTYAVGTDVSCSMTVSDGERSTSGVSSNSVELQNTPPEVQTVTIVNTTATTLYCNYTFADQDSHTENTSLTGFKWFINNEGDNNFLEVIGQTGQTLSTPLFDQNDRIKCEVTVVDSYSSDPQTSDPLNSSIYFYTENSVPQLTNINDTTSNSSPAAVGDTITFSAEWFDAQDDPETAQVFVCQGVLPEEEQYGDGNQTIGIEHVSDDTNALWLYPNQTGMYVERIAITPFKYTENDADTFAVDSNPETGDLDFGRTLSSSWSNYMYYDQDGSGHWDTDEAIIIDAAAPFGTYVAGTSDSIVTTGFTIPNNQILTNFSANNHLFYDGGSDGFDYGTDDIYYASALTSVASNHFRANLVTNASETKSFTQNIYDFYVYEVDNITDQSGILIAQDNDNSFEIGVTNYYTMQYNAKPFANKYLAIKVCIDTNNDEVCDDTVAQSSGVYLKADNTTSSEFIALYNNETYYNPYIQFVYGSLNGSQTTGCDTAEYCSTSLSLDTTLTCDYTAIESLDDVNTYYAKVCDDGGACSIYRQSTFYVNHLPETSDPIVYAYNDSFQLESITNNISSVDDNLYCDFTVSDEDSLWNTDDNATIIWYRNDSGTFQACDDFNNPNCPAGSSQILPYTLTMLNDQWYCNVTPNDQFVDGTSEISQIITVGFSDASPGTQPVLVNVTDNSDNSNIIYPGQELEMNITYRDLDSSKLRVYVCNGTSNNESELIARAAGCLGYELYRNVTEETSNPEVNTLHTAQFTIPSDYNGTYNYTVVLCDEDQQCSNTSSVDAQGEYTVQALATINEVYLTTSLGNITNSVVNDSDNLVCNYNITLAGIEYVNNYTGSFTYLFQYASGGDYVNQTGISNSSNTLPNSFTSLNDQWRCGVNVYSAQTYNVNYSTPVAVVDPEEPNTAPNLLSITINGGDPAATNVGDDVSVRVAWNDTDVSDTSVTMYMCAQGNISNSGCLERELERTTLTSEIETFDYTTQADDDFYQLLSFRICDDSFACSNILNNSMYVNHRPTATNVLLNQLSSPGVGQLLRCDYDYDTSLDGDDEDADNIQVTWYVGGAIAQQSNERTFNTGNSTGLIYCTIRVADIYGSVATSAQESSNALLVSNVATSVDIYQTINFTNQLTYQIYGNASYNFTNITVFVYNNSDRFTFQSNSTVTTVTTTKKGTTTVDVSREEGQSLIAIPLDDAFLFTSNTYISFENHNRPYFVYYNTTQNTSNINQLILEVTPALSSDIAQNEVITVYNNYIPSGWFNLSIPLYAGENLVELYSINLDTNITSDVQTVFDTLIVDQEQPYIYLNASTISPPQNTIAFDIQDMWSINTSTLLVNVSNTTTENLYNTSVGCSGNATEKNCSVTLDFTPNNHTLVITVQDYAQNQGQRTLALSATSLLPELTVLYVEQNNGTVSVDDTTYQLDDTDNGTTSFILTGQENITCAVTSTPLEYDAAEQSALSYIINNTNSGSTNLSFNVTSALEGFYQRYVICKSDDTSYQQALDEGALLEWYVDAAPPALTLNSPDNGSGQTSTFDINITTSDDGTGVQSVVYYITQVDNATTLSNGTLAAGNSQLSIDSSSYSGAFAVNITATDYTQNSTSKTYLFSQTQDTPIIISDAPGYANTALNFSIDASQFNNVSALIYDSSTLVSAVSYNSSSTIGAYRFKVDIDTSALSSKAYTLVQIANHSNGNYVRTEEVLLIDRTNPQYTSVTNTSGVNYNATVDIDLTITGADDNAFLSAVYLEHNATGTFENYTAVGSDGTYVGTLNASVTQPTSVVTWSMILVDRAGNTNRTSTQTLTISNADPAALQDFPNLVWAKQQDPLYFDLADYIADPDGDTLSYTVEATGTLAASVSPSGLLSLSGAVGTYNLTINATDPYGAELSTTVNATMAFLNEDSCSLSGTKIGFDSICTTSTTSSSSSGGGGGGGSSSSSSSSGSGFSGSIAAYSDKPFVRHTFGTVSPQFPAYMQPRSTLVPVVSLNLSVNQELENVIIEIEGLESLPGTVTFPTGYTVLDVFEIEHESISDSIITGARIEFKTNSSKVSDVRDVVLLRYTQGSWQEIETLYMREESGNYLFRATSPGLSVFVIAQKGSTQPVIVEQPTIESPPVQTEPEQPIQRPSANGATCFDNILNQGEVDVDCGGPCRACSPETQETQGVGSSILITILDSLYLSSWWSRILYL